MPPQRQRRKDRITALVHALELRKEHYYVKWGRVRSETSREHYYRQYQILRHVLTRYYQSTLIYVDQFGQVDILQYRKAEQYRRAEAERIQTGKYKFQTTHYYDPWFFSTSLGADYGQFGCDRCGRNFYHSPSRISKAAHLVYDCCCGYCTNEIIGPDHKTTPYT